MSLKNVVVHNNSKSLMMETNFKKERQFIAFRVEIIRRNCKNYFRVYACCFVNNTETYFSLFVCPCKLRGVSVRTRLSNVIFQFRSSPHCAWFMA